MDAIITPINKFLASIFGAGFGLSNLVPIVLGIIGIYFILKMLKKAKDVAAFLIVVCIYLFKMGFFKF